MDENADPTANDPVRDAIEHGGDLVGALAGGAVGLLGGPAGALGGAVAGVAITKSLRRVGIEVYDRLMVRRQKERVGVALAVVAADASERQAAGEQLRDDGFFDAGSSERSDADELLEGVLLHAADAYEERKLRHLGAILPSLAFRADVSAADGHWLTRIADRLSWRQLVVLAVFADPRAERILRQDVHRDEDSPVGATPPLVEEVEELGRLGLLGVLDGSGNLGRAGSTYDTTPSIWGAPKARWRLTEQGRLLVDVARLTEITSAETDDVLRELLK